MGQLIPHVRRVRKMKREDERCFAVEDILLTHMYLFPLPLGLLPRAS